MGSFLDKGVTPNSSALKAGLLVSPADTFDKCRGFLEITKHFADGSADIVVSENTVVNFARSGMAHLIAGDNVANYVINSMEFGDGGHNISNPSQPLATSVTDTGLFGSSVITKGVSISFPDGPTGTKVMFSSTILNGEANGAGSQEISEAVLNMGNGQIFAHKTFGLITKTSLISLTFNWTIIF